jgi:hypothetical protein
MSTAFLCFKFCIHESSNSVSKASGIMTGAEAAKSEHISCKLQLGHKSQQKQALYLDGRSYNHEHGPIPLQKVHNKRNPVIFQKDGLIDLCKTCVMTM